MEFLARASLAKKLTFLTIVLCAVSTFSILFFVNYTLMLLNDNYLNKELNSRKTNIEQVYVEPLWNFEKLQVKHLSESFLSDNGFAHIVAIKVSRPNGEILFNDSTSTQKFQKIEDYLQLPYTKYGSIDIVKKGEKLGSVEIIFTNAGFISKFKETLLKFILVSTIVLCITSVWIFVFFNKYLTHPLNELLEHVKQLEIEDYSPRTYHKLPHELHLIANALTFTSSMIKKRNEDLKHHTDNLEKIVAERSRELEMQISENVNSQRLVAVGEMASGIAHEINNPLTIIYGQIVKLKKQYKGHEIEKDLFSSLDKSVTMIERISKIIRGLKTIARNGNSDPMNRFEIQPILEEVKLLTEMNLSNIKAPLSIHMDSSVTHVYGREVQISQVLVNLINNSVDAIVALEERWIKVEVKDLGQVVEFRITDSGLGIPLEVRAKIMYPFFT